MSYSKLRDIATNTKYSPNMATPNPLAIFHFEQPMLIITNINIANNKRIVHAIPAEIQKKIKLV